LDPTGGIDLTNAQDFVRGAAAIAVGSSLEERETKIWGVM